MIVAKLTASLEYSLILLNVNKGPLSLTSACHVCLTVGSSALRQAGCTDCVCLCVRLYPAALQIGRAAGYTV